MKFCKYYNDHLPLEPKFGNIIEFEKMIKVDCKISNKEIIYFLKLPSVKETDFKLYKLHPIPAQYEDKIYYGNTEN